MHKFIFREKVLGTGSPYQQNLSFTCPILAYSRKTLHESSKFFVEHALHVARIQLQTQAWYSGLCYEHRFINQRTLAHKNPVWREKTRGDYHLTENFVNSGLKVNDNVTFRKFQPKIEEYVLR